MIQLPKSYEILRDIIKHNLSLADNDIWLENQQIDISNRGILYITLGLVNSQSYYNTRQYATIPDPNNPSPATVLQETLATGIVEIWRIDISSLDFSALNVKEQILLALRSTYAVQLMEANGLRIASIPDNIQNLSFLEGGSILSRYMIEIEIFTGYNTTNIVDSYTSLSAIDIITEN